jgi:L-ascorbate metabolism protein UlaG (beta-lactamase superfamily)
VSHSHFDHCDPSKIEKIRKEATLVIAPSDCSATIRGSITSLKPGEKTTFANITVEAVEAYNHRRFRSSGTPFHPRGLGVGYLITMDGKTIYFAGDTDFIPEMKKLKDIHLALLPTDGTYTMDNHEAAEAALTIKPKYVIPMHHFNTDPREFKRDVEARSEVKVLPLRPGDQIQV